jgi:thiamine-phosphate pyrophosphorylase
VLDRHPLPRCWLLTDPRQGEALWPALEAMPRGAGVIFRHYDVAHRRALFRRVQAIARRRRLVLLLGGPPSLAAAWRADGSYGADRRRPSPRSPVKAISVHDRAELVAAARSGATMVLLSPVFPTRSHPGARHLGRVRFGALARESALPVIALGGMDRRRARELPAYGWAGIDGWIRT